MKEEISALSDGESQAQDGERVLRALEADPELRRTWERYHLAGSALRRDLDLVLHPGLADRIHARLIGERPDNVIRWQFSRLGQVAAGLAIAASVAAVAIVNLSPGLSSSVVSVARSPAPPSTTTVAESRPLPPDQQRVLNPYLVRHGELNSAPGMNGMLSYVRVVSHDGTVVESNTSE